MGRFKKGKGVAIKVLIAFPPEGCQFSSLHPVEAHGIARERSLTERKQTLDFAGAAMLVVMCASWGLQQVAIKVTNPEVPPCCRPLSAPRKPPFCWEISGVKA